MTLTKHQIRRAVTLVAINMVFCRVAHRASIRWPLAAAVNDNSDWDLLEDFR